MGGRGSSSGAWKKQLKQYAKRGIIPKVIVAPLNMQSKIFKEIDNLYSMPDYNRPGVRVSDLGDAVHVQIDGKVIINSYPSGTNANANERRGVLKWTLRQHIN